MGLVWFGFGTQTKILLKIVALSLASEGSESGWGSRKHNKKKWSKHVNKVVGGSNSNNIGENEAG